jgi:hypothetical protein
VPFSHLVIVNALPAITSAADANHEALESTFLQWHSVGFAALQAHGQMCSRCHKCLRRNLEHEAAVGRAQFMHCEVFVHVTVINQLEATPYFQAHEFLVHWHHQRENLFATKLTSFPLFITRNSIQFRALPFHVHALRGPHNLTLLSGKIFRSDQVSQPGNLTSKSTDLTPREFLLCQRPGHGPRCLAVNGINQ